MADAEYTVKITGDPTELRKTLTAALKDLPITVKIDGASTKSMKALYDVGNNLKATFEALHKAQKDFAKTAQSNIPVITTQVKTLNDELSKTVDMLKKTGKITVGSSGASSGGVSNKQAMQTGVYREVADANKQLRNEMKNTSKEVTRLSKEVDSKNKRLETAKKRLQEAADSTKDFGYQLGNTTKRLSAYLLPAAAFFQLSRAIGVASEQIVEFDRSFNHLKQIITDFDPKEAFANIFNVAKTYGQSAVEIANIAKTLGQAGGVFGGTNLNKAVELLGKANLSATFQDIEQTTSGLIAFTNQFHLSFGEVIGVMDTANKLSKEFAINANEIFKSVQTGGGSFAAFGGDFKQFQVLVTAMKQLTNLSPSILGTAVSGTVPRIFSSDNLNMVEAMGAQIRKSNGELKEFNEILIEIGRSMSGLTLEEKAETAVRLVGRYHIKSFLPLLTDIGRNDVDSDGKLKPSEKRTSQLSKAMRAAQNATGSFNADVLTGLDRIDVKFKSVGAQFSEIFAEISQDKNFKRFIDDVVDSLSTVASILKSLAPLVASFLKIGTFAAIGAVIANKDKFIGGFKNAKVDGPGGLSGFGFSASGGRGGGGGSGSGDLTALMNQVAAKSTALKAISDSSTKQVATSAATQAVQAVISGATPNAKLPWPDQPGWTSKTQAVKEAVSQKASQIGFSGKVFHGEGNGPSGATSAGLGSWFGTDSRQYASNYGKVTEHDISIKNPYEMPLSEFRSFDRFAGNKSEGIKASAARRQELEKAGHDGIIIKHPDGTNEYVLFDSLKNQKNSVKNPWASHIGANPSDLWASASRPQTYGLASSVNRIDGQYGQVIPSLHSDNLAANAKLISMNAIPGRLAPTPINPSNSQRWSKNFAINDQKAMYGVVSGGSAEPYKKGTAASQLANSIDDMFTGPVGGFGGLNPINNPTSISNLVNAGQAKAIPSFGATYGVAGLEVPTSGRPNFFNAAAQAKKEANEKMAAAAKLEADKKWAQDFLSGPQGPQPHYRGNPRAHLNPNTPYVNSSGVRLHYGGTKGMSGGILGEVSTWNLTKNSIGEGLGKLKRGLNNALEEIPKPMRTFGGRLWRAAFLMWKPIQDASQKMSELAGATAEDAARRQKRLNKWDAGLIKPIQGAGVVTGMYGAAATASMMPMASIGNMLYRTPSIINRFARDSEFRNNAISGAGSALWDGIKGTPSYLKSSIIGAWQGPGEKEKTRSDLIRDRARRIRSIRNRRAMGAAWDSIKSKGGYAGVAGLIASDYVAGQMLPEQTTDAITDDNLLSIRQNKARMSGAVSGAASGAATGMMFGPKGAAVGAVIGGILGSARSGSEQKTSDIKDSVAIALRKGKIADAGRAIKLGETGTSSNSWQEVITGKLADVRQGNLGLLLGTQRGGVLGSSYTDSLNWQRGSDPLDSKNPETKAERDAFSESLLSEVMKDARSEAMNTKGSDFDAIWEKSNDRLKKEYGSNLDRYDKKDEKKQVEEFFNKTRESSLMMIALTKSTIDATDAMSKFAKGITDASLVLQQTLGVQAAVRANRSSSASILMGAKPGSVFDDSMISALTGRFSNRAALSKKGDASLRSDLEAFSFGKLSGDSISSVMMQSNIGKASETIADKFNSILVNAGSLGDEGDAKVRKAEAIKLMKAAANTEFNALVTNSKGAEQDNYKKAQIRMINEIEENPEKFLGVTGNQLRDIAMPFDAASQAVKDLSMKLKEMTEAVEMATIPFLQVQDMLFSAFSARKQGRFDSASGMIDRDSSLWNVDRRLGATNSLMQFGGSANALDAAAQKLGVANRNKANATDFMEKFITGQATGDIGSIMKSVAEATKEQQFAMNSFNEALKNTDYTLNVLNKRFSILSEILNGTIQTNRNIARTSRSDIFKAEVGMSQYKGFGLEKMLNDLGVNSVADLKNVDPRKLASAGQRLANLPDGAMFDTIGALELQGTRKVGGRRANDIVAILEQLGGIGKFGNPLENAKGLVGDMASAQNASDEIRKLEERRNEAIFKQQDDVAQIRKAVEKIAGIDQVRKTAEDVVEGGGGGDTIMSSPGPTETSELTKAIESLAKKVGLKMETSVNGQFNITGFDNIGKDVATKALIVGFMNGLANQLNRSNATESELYNKITIAIKQFESSSK